MGGEMAELHRGKQQGDRQHTEQIKYANIYNLIEKKDYMRHLILLGVCAHKFATTRRLRIAHSALNT